jgi:integrase/recombinase XerD
MMMSVQSGMGTTGPLEDLVEGYRDWLVSERGLAPGTVWHYVREARLFLSACGTADPQTLSLADVTGFVVSECRRRRVKSAATMVAGLRALLRYLYVSGITDRQLDAAVPAPAGWAGGGLPRWVGADEVAAMIGACDCGTAVGSRDHAIVTMLARLGLRAGEVATLSLDDVDWVRGEVVVRGKGGRTEALPLPLDVGEALVAYLRDGRPSTNCRAMFLQARPPFVGLAPAAIGQIVKRACVRAGLAPMGAHRLRHSAATGMLRAGGSLEEVGQVLRQRDRQVTAVYAKVDFVALRGLALPWPGDAA